jgi:uncharacterized protein YraI
MNAARRLLLYAAVVVLAGSSFASAAAQIAAVVTRNVNLRTGPSSSRAIIRLLTPPDELSILDSVRTNDYYEVRTPGGDHGWAWARNVRITGTTPATPVTAGPPEVYRSCPLVGSALQAHRQESNRKKNRVTRPAQADIDANVTLATLLQSDDDETRWSDARAASIVAFVVDVKKGGEETVNCGETDSLYRDTHIDVVLDPQDRPKVVRVIVEVTPRWRAFIGTQGENWTTRALSNALEGHWVRFTGWLFWDFEHADEATHTNPNGDNLWRATAWEIHPVREIRICPASPANYE